MNGIQNFDKNWTDYENGFGSLTEFWIVYFSYLQYHVKSYSTFEAVCLTTQTAIKNI